MLQLAPVSGARSWNGCPRVLAGQYVIRRIYHEMALLYHVKKCMIRHTDKCQNAAVPRQNIQQFTAFLSTTVTLKWCYKLVQFVAVIVIIIGEESCCFGWRAAGLSDRDGPAPPLALRTWPAGSPQGGRESRNESRAWLMSACRNRKWIKWDSSWQNSERSEARPHHNISDQAVDGQAGRVLSGLDCL